MVYGTNEITIAIDLTITNDLTVIMLLMRSLLLIISLLLMGNSYIPPGERLFYTLVSGVARH